MTATTVGNSPAVKRAWNEVDRAMRAAISATDREMWLRKATERCEALRSVALSCGGPGSFTGEDIRVTVAVKIGEPDHPNVWGGLMLRLRFLGLIEATGETRPMRRKGSHRRQTPVYRWVA